MLWIVMVPDYGVVRTKEAHTGRAFSKVWHIVTA